MKIGPLIVPKAHALIIIDFGVIGISCGAMYYELSNDVFRPAFIDLQILGRWRISWEFAKIRRLYG